MITSGHTIALVTGANKGLGRETTRRLAELGWTVWLGARNVERGRRTAAELATAGDARFVQLDVTSPESVTAAADILAPGGRLDVLINNAGIAGSFGGADEVTPEDFLPVFDVNLLGPVRTVRAFTSLLRASSHPRIVNVSSGMGSFAVTHDPDRIESTLHTIVYPASKAALNMVTSQLAKGMPWATVSAVDPGYTATDFNFHTGPQTVEVGAEAILAAACADPGAPSGTFTDRHGLLGW